MSETLRDLVVSLSLQTDNFTRNIKSVNKQIAEAESKFKLAAAGVEGFERSTTGLSTQLSTLNRRLELQKQVVDQYERALQAADKKLQECVARQNDYAQRLVDAKAAQQALKEQVASAASAYRDYVARLGESDQQTLDAKASLDALKNQYRQAVQEVKKLAGQNTALKKTTQNAADAFTQAGTNLNMAQAAVKSTEADITKCNSALALSQTKWDAAGQVIVQTSQAIASIGGRMQEAESRFQLAAAGVKDFDTSTQGLTARLALLQERLRLQNQAVGEYQTRLAAAQDQLQAAQSVNDVDRIRQATDAITVANTALNKAQAAVRITEAEINDCNAALALSRTQWDAASQTIQRSQQALNSVSISMKRAESSFRLITANIDDIGQSVTGLNAKLDLLNTQWDLQDQAISHYETALQAAREQLAAAQAVNDPEKIRQATDAVTEAEAALNDAYTALSNTNRQIDETNQALALAESGWYEAEQAVESANTAITTLGKQLSLAESRFKLASAGIKDVDKSVEGLAAKLTLLNDKLSLQRQTVVQYEAALEAAADQLRAAQQAGDPEKIQQASDAVIDAEAALNRAKAAVRATAHEIEETNKKLRTAKSAWTAAGKSLEDFGKKCDSVSKGLSTVGRTLSTAVTTPILALGTTAVKASLDFESSFASVRKTVDATEAEFDALAASSKKMSTQIGTSTSEINEVMATGGQLGIANQYLVDFARTMIDLGNSCEDLDATEAATSIAKFANIMGTNQSLFSNIGSTIVALGNNFATTERPIMEMAQRLAGAGKQVGLTEAQVLGFATALSSVGIEAQMGGTALSKALVNMEVACATGGEALDEFAMVCGLTADQFKVLFEIDPAAAFQAFITGLAQMDDEGISAIAVLNEIGIAEVRLRDTLLRSVNATELFAEAQDMANQAWNENNALTIEAEKRYATTSSRLSSLKNKALLFAQQLGDDLNPTIQNLIAGADELLDKLLNMDEAQRQQIIKYAAIAAAAGPVILTLGKVTKGIGVLSTGIGKFATAVGKAGGGFSGFLSVLGKSPSVWLAVAAAVVVGTVALADYVSGAKQAREALEGMNETAQKWKDTAAETFYGNSEGLSFFGMSKSDFVKETQSAQDWMNGLLAVWTDGEKETDEIVDHWTNSFKSLTASTRSELQAMKDTADLAGYTSVSEGLQADIEMLDALDAEIESLLQKRQNGFFTEADQQRLQELVDMRGAIEIKYHLSPADVDGFDTIRQKLDAEIARAQARNQSDADVTIYENAMVAAAEGLAAVNAEIDAQYDKEYALIQLIEDETERQAAMEELNIRYQDDRRNAAIEYAELLSGIVMPVWEQEDIQQAASDIEQLTQLLRQYSTANQSERPAILEDINELTASMDEAALVEYLSVLTQIQSLLDSGMDLGDIEAMFPEIDFSTALEQIAAIQGFLNNRELDLPGLNTMFGDALPEEVLKIATDLDMTGAQERWDAFAADPGAITTDVIVAGYSEAEGSLPIQPQVEAFIAKYTITDATDTSQLTPEGLIAYVATYAEATTGADVSGLTPENVIAIVSGYKELASGTDISTLKPDEITAYISDYAEQQGVDLSGLTPAGITATVLAYEEVTGGALTTLLTPTDITAMVTRYLEAEGIDISKLNPDQIEAIVTSFAEATGCDKSQLLQNFTATIVAYDDTNAVRPKLNMSVGIYGYDLMAYRKFIAENPVEVQGIVKLGEIYENPADVLYEPNTKFFQDGQEIPVEAVPVELLTAEKVAVLSDDGTLHVLIAPEVTGTEEAIEAISPLVDEVDQLGVTAVGAWAGLVPTTTVDMIGSAIGRINSYIETLDYNGLQKFFAALGGATVSKGTLNSSMTSDFSPERVAELSAYVGELVAAIMQGQQVSEQDIANLQMIVTFLQGLDTTETGTHILEGIGEGMTAAGWDSDAETVASNLETALNMALGIQSPSTRVKPVGNNVSAGVGVGMTEYDFSGDAASMAAGVESAANASLTATTLQPVGVNAMRGLTAGINAGRSGVITAMRSAARAAVNAAKAELQIHSPSDVFKREVGVMSMRGFGEGVLEETKAQAKVIRNASRYLTGEAREGSIAAVSNDNRRTYNSNVNSTIQVQQMVVRDEQDIRSLAVEIATLTRRQQRGRGLRMA